MVLSNGRNEFGENDTCVYGEFVLLDGHPTLRSSLVIVVNEPEGVFVQHQEAPTWSPMALVDQSNFGVGALCDEGGQCTEIPARYFVSPDTAWKAVENFIIERSADTEMSWQPFDLKTCETEICKGQPGALR